MTFVYVLLAAIPLCALTYSVISSVKKQRAGVSSRRVLRTNLLSFAALVALLACFAFGASAADTNDAAPAAGTETTQAADNNKGMGLLAAGLVTGLAGIGGGIAIAAGAPAAIGATSENPKVFGKAMIFVALGEAIAIYGLVISFMILNKV